MGDSHRGSEGKPLLRVKVPLLVSLSQVRDTAIGQALFRVSEFSQKTPWRLPYLVYIFKRGFIPLSIPCLPNSPEFELRVLWYKILEFSCARGTEAAFPSRGTVTPPHSGDSAGDLEPRALFSHHNWDCAHKTNLTYKVQFTQSLVMVRDLHVNSR